MRLAGRIGAGLGVLLVLLGLAAWLVPPMLDWTRYRDEIATLATQRLGRTVRIGGPVSLSLLPEPVLAVSRVSVDDGEPDRRDDGAPARLAIGVGQMRLRVGLAALLAGRIEARDLVLRGLDVRLPWPLDTSVSALRAPTWLSAVSARIEGGRLGIGDVAFSNIDATLSTGGLTGSYQATGTATLTGRAWRFTVRATQPGADGSSGIDLTLDGQGPVQDVGLVLSGQIDGGGNFGGRAVARGPDLSQVLPAPRVAFRAEGRVTVAGGLAAADDLAVEIGGSPARGAVAFRLSPVPRLDAALAAGRIDLDAWLPTLLRGGPAGLSLGIDLSAEAADLAGGTLRHLRGAFDLADGALAVREFQAMLPGEAELRLSGAIRQVAPGRPRFEGEAHLAAPALRTTLAWAESAGAGPISALPGEALRSADLAGHVVIEPGLAGASGLTGRIDASAVAGTAAARLGGRGRPAISAALQVDRLALDPWLPATSVRADGIAERLRAVDIDLRLDARSATARGLTLAPFALDGASEGGTVTLRHLGIAAGETRLVASGVVSASGRVADAHLDIQARQAEPLAALLPDPLARWLNQAPALLRSPVRLQLSGSGPPEAVSLRVVGELGDLRLEAQPSIDLARDQWSAPLTLRHPGAPRLAEALGVSGATAWLGDGSLALIATLSGSPGRLVAEAFDLTAGALHASGQAALDRRGPKPFLSGRIAAETLPLPLPYLRSPVPLALDALSGWDAAVALAAGQVLVGATVLLEQATTVATLRDGALRLDAIAGRLGGGTVAGSLALDAAARPPALAIEARIAQAGLAGALFDSSVDLTAGTLDAALSVHATGYAPAALAATLTGTVTADVARGTLSGVALDRLASLSDADVEAGLAGGVTPFERLHVDGRLNAGVLTVDAADLSAPLVEANASGTIDIAHGSADLRLLAVPVAPSRHEAAPEIGLRLSGPMDKLRRVPELAALAGWRARDIRAFASPALPEAGPVAR